MEKELKPTNGYFALLMTFLVIIAGIAFVFIAKSTHNNLFIVGALALFLVFIITTIGFFVINPNESMVLILFGEYKGTAKQSGFFWVNPFYTKSKISLRLRNMNGDKLKVNDALGNPIDIAMVLVWKVTDTFKSKFNVDDYQKYVDVQSEAALRSLSSAYPYDNFDDNHQNEITLRSSTSKVNEALENELDERLNKAGVSVVEARISHLAYAQEIAHAMLQRQQASAVVAARSKIVEGAVGMVEMALHQLKEKDIIELDGHSKAAMVSNLLVVLCSDKAASPIVNAGTLHH